MTTALSISVDPEAVAGLLPDEQAALLNREWEACRDAYLTELSQHHADNRARYTQAAVGNE